MEKDVALGIQMKLTVILTIKRDKEMANQKNNFLMLALQRRPVKVLKDSVRRDKEKWKVKKTLGHYLKGLKTKIIKSKEYTVGLFDQG